MLYWILLLHVLSGTMALVLGSVVIALKKGTLIHRRTGSVFWWALGISLAASVPLAYTHQRAILLLIAQFTAYLLLTGRFVLLPQGLLVKRSWWALWSSMAIVMLFLTAWGGVLVYRGNIFGWVMLGFGALSYLFVVQDYQWLRGNATKVHPHARHLQRMVGAYIASLTAFLIVNNHLLPSFIIWCLPAALLLPLILRWSKMYDKPEMSLLDEQD